LRPGRSLISLTGPADTRATRFRRIASGLASNRPHSTMKGWLRPFRRRRSAIATGLRREAGRRRLARAVPALEALCRGFKAFGLEHEMPEQAAALAGLAAIGGRDAAGAVARIIVGQVVQGPGLKQAVGVAARLGVILPNSVVLPLLRHAAPEVRANACRCASAAPEVATLLIDLLEDLNGGVAREAACTLGRMGRIESRAALTRLLREDPTTKVIEAVSMVADDVCLVLLGRIAGAGTARGHAALAALDNIEGPRAARIAAAARRSRGGAADAQQG
jgi:HEAT repeats